jgi:hypothetical protein
VERERTAATVSAKDFEHWLTQTLSGKRLDPARGHEEGRIIFLLEDAPGACRRTDVVMKLDRIEVRNGRTGSEQLTEMTIHADTESWVRYLESPAPENLEPIRIYGYPYLYETLISLLTRRTSMVALRAGVAEKAKDRKKRRRSK